MGTMRAPHAPLDAPEPLAAAAAGELLQAVLADPVFGILVTDEAGRVATHNARFLELFSLEGDLTGLEEAQVVGRAARATVERGALPQAALESEEGEVHATVELRDGRVLRGAVRSLRSVGWGRVWRFRDITAKTRANERARTAEQRLTEVQAVARIGTWSYDVAAEQVRWSPELARLYGIDLLAESAPMDVVYESYVRPDGDRLRAAATSALVRAAPFTVRGRIKHPGGGIRVIEVRGRPVRGEDGRVTRMIGTGRDVTDEARALDRARVAEERLRRMFDDAPYGQAIVRLDGALVRANAALASLLDRPQSDLERGLLWDFVELGGDDRGHLGERLSAGETVVLERSLVRRGYDDHDRWVTLTASPLHDELGAVVEAAVSFVDVTAERAVAERGESAGMIDGLTGLPNATRIQEVLRAAAARSPGAGLAVVHVDVDGMSAINAAHGRDVGDEVLIALAHRFRRAAPPEAVVARTGGDEFSIVCVGVASEETALTHASRLVAVAAVPLRIGDVAVVPRIGVGVTYPPPGEIAGEDVAATLLREAESAADEARRLGTGAPALFTEAQRRRLHEDARLLRDLEAAVETGDGLQVVYQPAVSLQTGELLGLEALLRWRHPELGSIPPDRFILLAERSSLIARVGRWVATEVCGLLRAWGDAGLPIPRVAINVSARELERPEHAAELAGIVEAAGLTPDHIVIEVTETALLRVTATLSTAIDDLRGRGFFLYLDDFGTGGASLSFLRTVSMSGFKVDRSFLRGVPADAEATGILEGILAVGRAVGARIVAEGVETLEQAAALRELGTVAAQGWLFSRPLAAEHVPQMLVDGVPVAWEVAQPEATMTLREAERLLGVSASTVRRMADAGQLPSVRTEGGHRRLVREAVVREAARRGRQPAVRAPRLPERPLSASADLLQQRPEQVREVALRTMYVGDDHGWLGTTGGAAACERWLRALGVALRTRDWRRAREATVDLRRRAVEAGVPVLELICLVDAVVRATAMAVTTGEAAELPRLGVALRRVAVEPG